MRNLCGQKSCAKTVRDGFGVKFCAETVRTYSLSFASDIPPFQPVFSGVVAVDVGVCHRSSFKRSYCGGVLLSTRSSSSWTIVMDALTKLHPTLHFEVLFDAMAPGDLDVVT